jgi:two-component system, OmpR family, sensor histidine kinase QseC
MGAGSLQRRLLLYLLLCAPLVWAVALGVSADRARHEVNELFDTEIIRLARQVQATLEAVDPGGAAAQGALAQRHPATTGRSRPS